MSTEILSTNAFPPQPRPAGQTAVIHDGKLAFSSTVVHFLDANRYYYLTIAAALMTIGGSTTAIAQSRGGQVALPTTKSASTPKPIDVTKPAPITPVTIDPKADPKTIVDQALKAYEGGQYGTAAALLAGDLQNNPNDGQVHYYLGLALKKQGYDMSALHELEKAARLCPPAMIKRFADEQIGNLDEPEPLDSQKTQAAAPGNDWFAGLSNSISQMFGAKPTPPSTSSTTPSKSSTLTTSAAAGTATAGGAGSGANAGATNIANSAGQFSFPVMPDFMGQIKDAVKQGKKMLRQAKDQGAAAIQSTPDFSRRRVGEAEIMHMGEMQALVDKSHAMNIPDWASSPSGLTAYNEAPENTPEWDYWIGRFKRAFQHVLMRRLNTEAKDEVRGAAACIFSVDRQGNLRGQVYASTADSALNKALVEAVRDLNHSRILKFPSTSRINGWNFQMSWNFGIYMAIVKSYRQAIQREETIQALLKIVKEDTAIKATIKAGEEKRAKAKRLAADKALAAKLKAAQPKPIAKAEVSGQIVTRASERELRAVALELKDLSPVAPDASKPNEDPFANINDQTINSWPDLNR